MVWFVRSGEFSEFEISSRHVVDPGFYVGSHRAVAGSSKKGAPALASVGVSLLAG